MDTTIPIRDKLDLPEFIKGSGKTINDKDLPKEPANKYEPTSLPKVGDEVGE